MTTRRRSRRVLSRFRRSWHQSEGFVDDLQIVRSYRTNRTFRYPSPRNQERRPQPLNLAS
jgi:hypothetical protein